MRVSSTWPLIALMSVVGPHNTAIARDFLTSSRDKFVAAYNSQRYDQLCGILHQDASFRGRVNPGKWSHTADQIVTERWNSQHSCTDMSKGKQPEKRNVQIFTVGESNISLTPSRQPASLSQNSYALDTGKFLMAPKSGGSSSKGVGGAYVMLWKMETGEWKMIHIDMAPETGIPAR